MNITTVESKRAGEQYYVVEHPSGLHIMIYPKPGFHSAYAVFGTRYGSIDTRFRRSDESDVSEVPAGIAHFWSISSLKTKIVMRLPVMRKLALLQMRILLLT